MDASEVSIRGIIKSAVTDSVKSNASFASASGLRAKITRTAGANACEECASLAGSWYYGSEPKKVYWRHGGCTCTVTYDPGTGKTQNVHTKAWSESNEVISKRKEFAISNDQNYHLNNPLPKGYEDTRTIGETISSKDLQSFIDNAKIQDIQIGVIDNPSGGFENYRGDIQVLYDVLEETKAQMYNLDVGKVILKYDNVLDGGNVDVNTFAQARGVTITLNKFMYDDSSFLESEYKKAANSGFFVRGSTAKNIITHEMGHIADYNLTKSNQIANALKELSGDDINAYIESNISIYATTQNAKSRYTELYSEVLCLEAVNPGNEVIKLLKGRNVIT